MDDTRPYRVVYMGGYHFYVVARNHRTVAQCASERSARRIARLLNADIEGGK